MDYEGVELIYQWMFLLLTNDSTLMTRLGHTVQSNRIFRGPIPEKPTLPSLYFVGMMQEPVLGVTSDMRCETFQFTILAKDQDSHDPIRRRIRAMMDPLSLPGLKMGGSLRILYVKAIPFAGVAFEDPGRRGTFRMDFRYDLGYAEQ